MPLVVVVVVRVPGQWGAAVVVVEMDAVSAVVPVAVTVARVQPAQFELSVMRLLAAGQTARENRLCASP